jgi:outer membrane protein insertion porin family/translocation and assembly module TamA
LLCWTGWLLASPALHAQDSLPGKLQVMGLTFEGNHAIDDYTLGISIATSNSSAWARSPALSWLGLGEHRYFDEREFRRDVARLQLLYSQSGFLEARIDTVVERDSTSVRIRFLIDEGPPVLITQVSVTGVEGILPEHALLTDLPLAVGDPFNRLRLRASTDTIVSALENRGYPFAQVFRGFEVDRGKHTAQVTFDVDPGPRARVSAVEVVGAERIPASMVRSVIPIRVGAPYRAQDLYAAQRDLYRTGAFDYVDVHLVDSIAEGPADSLVAVQVRVREGSLYRVRLAGGYGTLDCFRTLGGLTAHHFLGGARELDVSARLSKIGTGEPFSWGLQDNVCRGLGGETDSSRLALNYNVTASLTQPVLLVHGTSATLSFTGERRSELLAYVREAIGGDLALTYRRSWDLPITLSYSLERGSTKAEPASFCVYLNVCRTEDIAVFQEPLVQSALSLVVLRNHQNSLLNPTRGNQASVELKWASPLIGSDSLAQFTRVLAQWAMYLRAGRNGVLAWRVQAGTIVPATLGSAGQSLKYVPPEERFYGGGPNSVRGFGQNELGPQVRVIQMDSVTMQPDTVTSASGGNDLMFANVEYRLRLPGFAHRLEGALFVDAGQVFVRGNEVLKYQGLRITPGIGLRFDTGIGPIRLDVGYNGYGPEPGPLYRTEGSQLILVESEYAPPAPASFWDRLQLHFSVGQAF